MDMETKLSKVLKLKHLLQLYKLYKLNRAIIKPKRLWSKPWLLRRDQNRLGVCAFLQYELTNEDPSAYKNYVRMTEDQFEYLHSQIEQKIKRQDTQLRQAISSRYRLITTFFWQLENLFKVWHKALGSVSQLFLCLCRKYVALFMRHCKRCHPQKQNG